MEIGGLENAINNNVNIQFVAMLMAWRVSPAEYINRNNKQDKKYFIDLKTCFNIQT